MKCSLPGALTFAALFAVGCGNAPDARPTSSVTPITVTTQSIAPTIIPLAVPTAALPPTSERTPAPYPGGPALLDEVLTLIERNYVDADAIDLAALRDTYRPPIVAAPNRDAVYRELVALVASLEDRHSRFIPPAVQAPIDSDGVAPTAAAGIGALLAPTRGGALVQVIYPDGPAARANIQPRDRIIAVNGRAYTELDGDLTGTSGDMVRLAVARPGTKPFDVVLRYEPVVPRITPITRRFAGEIGYLAIPSLWVDDMGDYVSGALTDLLATGRLQGLILDVRGNRGGWEPVLVDVLGHFSRGTVGNFVGRDETRSLVVGQTSGPDLRRLPLVVLTDNETASYAEVLAAVLAESAGAQIVGSRSAGNTETIYNHTLSDGSRLWLAQERFRLLDGRELEGVGVTPDVELDLDWAAFSLEDDPHILDALRLLGAGPK